MQRKISITERAVSVPATSPDQGIGATRGSTASAAGVAGTQRRGSRRVGGSSTSSRRRASPNGSAGTGSTGASKKAPPSHAPLGNERPPTPTTTPPRSGLGGTAGAPGAAAGTPVVVTHHAEHRAAGERVKISEDEFYEVYAPQQTQAHGHVAASHTAVSHTAPAHAAAASGAVSGLPWTPTRALDRLVWLRGTADRLARGEGLGYAEQSEYKALKPIENLLALTVQLATERENAQSALHAAEQRLEAMSLGVRVIQQDMRKMEAERDAALQELVRVCNNVHTLILASSVAQAQGSGQNIEHQPVQAVGNQPAHPTIVGPATSSPNPHASITPGLSVPLTSAQSMSGISVMPSAQAFQVQKSHSVVVAPGSSFSTGSSSSSSSTTRGAAAVSRGLNTVPTLANLQQTVHLQQHALPLVQAEHHPPQHKSAPQHFSPQNYAATLPDALAVDHPFIQDARARTLRYLDKIASSDVPAMPRSSTPWSRLLTASSVAQHPSVLHAVLEIKKRADMAAGDVFAVPEPVLHILGFWEEQLEVARVRGLLHGNSATTQQHLIIQQRQLQKQQQERQLQERQQEEQQQQEQERRQQQRRDQLREQQLQQQLQRHLQHTIQQQQQQQQPHYSSAHQIEDQYQQLTSTTMVQEPPSYSNVIRRAHFTDKHKQFEERTDSGKHVLLATETYRSGWATGAGADTTTTGVEMENQQAETPTISVPAPPLISTGKLPRDTSGSTGEASFVNDTLSSMSSAITTTSTGSVTTSLAALSLADQPSAPPVSSSSTSSSPSAKTINSATSNSLENKETELGGYGDVPPSSEVPSMAVLASQW